MYLSQECASLADRLINGQVALAQGAEEMFILKKKLSVAERKLATLEKTNTDKQSNVVDMTVNNDVKHVEGAGECVREEEGGRLQPDEDCILVKTPIHVHVCREEAEVMTRVHFVYMYMYVHTVLSFIQACSVTLVFVLL